MCFGYNFNSNLTKINKTMKISFFKTINSTIFAIDSERAEYETSIYFSSLVFILSLMYRDAIRH